MATKKKKPKPFIEIEKVIIEHRMITGDNYRSYRCTACRRDLKYWANYIVVVRNGVWIESESVCENCIARFTAIRHPSSST